MCIRDSVKGVVDSSDLPLNVSRELLQESRDVKAIREGCTKRVLGMLEDLAKNDKAPEASADGVTDVLSDEDKAAAAEAVGKYTRFYNEFGAVLKEGLGEDYTNKDRIAKLLRFASSTTDAVSAVSYTHLDVYKRQACDKLRYEAINDSGLYEDAPNLEVRVTFDKDAKTLTITDNGIGMSAQEAIDHLGTIAKSGTKDFVSKLSGDQKADSQLIGQFGVGFYLSLIHI